LRALTGKEHLVDMFIDLIQSDRTQAPISSSMGAA
jgi:hypothetical protein